MLNINDVLTRVLQLPGFENKRREDFVEQTIAASFNLAAINGGVYGSVSNQTMQIPTGAVIVGMCGGASNVGGASTASQRPGNDMYTIGITYNQQRNLVGPGQVQATALFGPYNDLFPAKEIIVPTSGSLLFSLTSLVTDAIAVWVNAHCLTYNQIQ